MRPFKLFILFFFAACNNQATTSDFTSSKTYDTLSNGLRIINRTIDSPYYYKDIVSTDSLQGGCQIYYAEDDISYFLYLKRGDTLSLLNKTDKFNSLHSLGVLIEDEKTNFILGHDQGNGVPYTYEFIDKQTGENVLGYGIEFLDWTKFNENIYLLYIDTTNKYKQLVLFNSETEKKELYELPSNYWELYFDTLTGIKLGIKFTLDRNGDTTRTAMYSR